MISESEIPYNCPAIKGGCVPAFCAKKRDGTLFASHGTNFLAYTSVAVQG
jgi:hypothetical protein